MKMSKQILFAISSLVFLYGVPTTTATPLPKSPEQEKGGILSNITSVLSSENIPKKVIDAIPEPVMKAIPGHKYLKPLLEVIVGDQWEKYTPKHKDFKDPFTPEYEIYINGLDKGLRKMEKKIPVWRNVKDRDFWVYIPTPKDKESNHSRGGIYDTYKQVDENLPATVNSFIRKIPFVDTVKTFFRPAMPSNEVFEELSKTRPIHLKNGLKYEEAAYLGASLDIGHSVQYKLARNLSKPELSYLGITTCDFLQMNTEIAKISSDQYKLPGITSLLPFKLPSLWPHRYKADISIKHFLPGCVPSTRHATLEKYTRFPIMFSYLLKYNGREYWVIPHKPKVDRYWWVFIGGIHASKWTIVERDGWLGKKGRPRVVMKRYKDEIWRVVGDGHIHPTVVMMVFSAVRRKT